MVYTIDPSKNLYERITDTRLDCGYLIEPEETYKVAVWTSVKPTPEGRRMWDIVRDYILAKRGQR